MTAKLFVILFIGFSTCSSMYAQQLIKGRILDENDRGLNLCHISNVQSNTTTTSDTLGFFSIVAKKLPVVLEFSHVKYEPLIIRIDSASFIQVSLAAKSYTLGEIEIIDTSQLDSDLVFESKSITEFSSIFGEADISKYLVTLPGVSSINSFDAGFSVRGGATTENQFLIEGMKISDPRHMSTLVTSFDSYVFNSSEIYKSGFPVTYNGYLSSYTDMKSTPPELDYPSQVAGEITLGMVSSSAKVGALIDGKNGAKHMFKTSARYSYLDLVSDANDIFVSEQNIPKYRIFDHSMAYRAITKDQKWNIGAFSILSQDNMPLELTNGDLHQMKWNSYSLGLTAMGAIGVNGFLKLGVGQNRKGASYRLASINQQRHAIGLTNTNLLTEYDFTIRRSSFHVGLRTERNNYEIEHNTETITSNWIYNGYVSWSHEVNNFNTMLGVNFGKLNTISNIDLAPRLKIRYRLDDLEVIADYARSFQYEEYLPFFTVRTPIDIPVPIGSQNNPAHADQLSIGAYSSYFNNLKLYIGGFYKDMHHLKEFTAESRIALNEIEILEGDGYAYGSELELRMELSKLMLRANYTWSRSERRFQEINDGSYYSPPFDINSSITISSSFNITKQFRFLALWTYSSGIHVTIPEGVTIAKDITDPASLINYIPIYKDRYNYQLPSRHRLDLTLEYTKIVHEDAIKIILGTYNTYNRQNPDFIFLDIETVDEFFVSFVPKSKVVVPFIPYLSLTYYFNYGDED